MRKKLRGQVVRVTTTMDECIRVTVDIDSGLVPAALNIIGWKNNMVDLSLAEGIEKDEFFDG